MSSTYYRLYLNQVFTLVKTLVIKSELNADTMNRYLSEIGIDVSTDPKTWKYYMNLAGLYHSTDKSMTVTSMDTLETIEFSKESLNIHRATRSAYAYGSRYYNDLVNRFPDQELLINGILNPVDINKAILAKDGEILYYDKSLVESQEISLIPELQSWIYTYMTRWHVPGYSFVDDYYSSAYTGVMYSHIPMVIMNMRLERCLTDEAHSFHIREYLAGQEGLDVFIPYLNLKQQLFLYRNIRYIQRHAGQQDTFKWLLERIVNERNIPLARYDTIQLTGDNLTELLRPDVTLYRKDLNRFPNDGSLPNRSVSSILELQFPMANSNPDLHLQTIRPTEEKIEISTIGNVKSKIFESTILDTTDSVPFTREEILLNHWAYLVGTGRFQSIITITNPLTGTSIQLSAKDAFVIYMFSFNASNGIVLEQIPEFQVNRVQKSVIPTIPELQEKWKLHHIDPEFIANAHERQPSMGTYISVLAFREFIDAEYSIQNQQRNWWVNSETIQQRADKESFLSDFYCDTTVRLDTGQYYEDWFEERGLDFFTLGPLDHDLIFRNIVKVIGGSSVGASSKLATLQAETLKLMGRLSSYGVQYIPTINNTAFRILDTRYCRLDNSDSRYIGHRDIDIGGMSPLIIGGSGLQVDDEFIMTHRVPKIGNIMYDQVSNQYEIDPTIKYRVDSGTSYHTHIDIGRVKLKVDEDLSTPETVN